MLATDSRFFSQERLCMRVSQWSKEKEREFEQVPYEDTKEHRAFNFDIMSRQAYYDLSYETQGRFSVRNTSHFIIARMGVDEFSHVEYYAPFLWGDYGATRTFAGVGWLTIGRNEMNHSIHICRVDNFSLDHIKGIGTALIQFAIEKSFRAGLEGRVSLVSANGSAEFYLKMGFICDDPASQKCVVSEVDASKKVDGGRMILSDSARAIWRGRIASSPLLLEGVECAFNMYHISSQMRPVDPNELFFYDLKGLDERRQVEGVVKRHRWDYSTAHPLTARFCLRGMNWVSLCRVKGVGKTEAFVPYLFYSYLGKMQPRQMGYLMLGYSQEKKGVEILEIHNLSKWNEFGEKTQRVGSALIQCVVEMSIQKGYRGRVEVKSTEDSTLFFLKMGFVPHERGALRDIERALVAGGGLPSGQMVLKGERLKEWKVQIAKGQMLTH
ncbi:MAG: hypothetical protein S4CHLAM102_02570 [Chlamydiia bacterium]|nr:hypothetical protein [Chlamydiia bacterium]